MREIVSLHIGQAGAQIGNAQWEILNLEHQIQPDGSLNLPNESENYDQTFKQFYNENEKKKFVPRALYIDTESSVIDQIQNGDYKQLYRQDQFIGGKEDASNNYVRGHYTIGRHMVDQVLEKIRKQIEKCDKFQGFSSSFSINGGTCGLATLLKQRLSCDYEKSSNINTLIVPSPNQSTTVVEPYNAVLCLHDLLGSDQGGVNMIYDNESINDICKQSLDIYSQSYKHINELIAQVYSSTTLSMRFRDSVNNTDINQLQQNLINYPRLCWLVQSYAPIIPVSQQFQYMNSIEDLTRLAFDQSTLMLKYDKSNTTYYSSCINYRGDIVNSEVFESINKIKIKRQLIPNLCFQVGLHTQSTVQTKNSAIGKTQTAVCTISNTNIMENFLCDLNLKFDKMYAKRAFAHFFLGEGLSDGIFGEAREDLAALEKDYYSYESSDYWGEDDFEQ